MKVPQSVRQLYEELRPRYELLEGVVNEILHNRKERSWHYTSRLKGLESFTQKLETGRFLSPSEPEDFFACTLVVENQTAIARAEELVVSLFKLEERRPREHGKTPHRPPSFDFDDLRIYASYSEQEGRRPTGAEGLRFEVQIKTFLLHAWGIATHDLIYKSGEVDWTTSRIAYQVKAMLEHAEASIATARKIAQFPEIRKEDEATVEIRTVIKWLQDTWSEGQLPKDTLRLAESIADLAKTLGLELSQVFDSVHSETQKGRGAKLVNLSPHGVVVKSLLERSDASARIKRIHPRVLKRRRIFVPAEIDYPEQEPVVEGALLRI